MKESRRKFLRGSALFGATLMAGKNVEAQHHHGTQKTENNNTSSSVAFDESAQDGEYLPVQMPDLTKLPYTMDNGVKVFNLIAEPVKQELVPGRVIDAWGFNGSSPGPTIEVMEGDRVRILFDNHLPELTSMHWHGLEVPIEMDGMPGISQDPVEPGGRFVYEFTLHQHGTFFYHSHMAMQEMMGMIGFFIIHPKKPYLPRVDKDYGYVLQEWAILPNSTIPNTLSMEFNWLTMNGKAAPATTPLIVKQGERVRLRFINMGMDHHPIHLHGVQFEVTGTEGGRIPVSARYPGNTVIVGVAQARDIEFEAKYIGDWMLHCHFPHHMMNGMVSMVGPMMMDMGPGMHTGMGMQEGMGVVRQDHALGEGLGPALGRNVGMPDREKNISNLVGSKANDQVQKGNDQSTTDDQKPVPGYPQDMYMPMDADFVKPETYGLREGWTGGSMGMMTLVRVMKPEMYDKITAMINKDRPNEQPRQMPKQPTPMSNPDRHSCTGKMSCRGMTDKKKK